MLSTRLGDGSVRRIEATWPELVARLSALGRVMCLTRNEAAVHERHGKFERCGVHGDHNIGTVLGPDIDLRLFYNQWHCGFSVTDTSPRGTRRSLQFFDRSGDAVLKVHLTDRSDEKAFAMLTDAYAAADAGLPHFVKADESPGEGVADAGVDVAAFRQGWLDMTDTHDFFVLQRRHRLGREQALRLAPENHARKLDNRAVQALLESAAERSVPIMAFVGNRGCIQIHTGEVKRILSTEGDWLNVMDPDFNLHLRQPLVNSVWRVWKPTKDGRVTSIELYDAQGREIALFFGKRKPGQAELDTWRECVETLEDKFPES